MFFNNCGILLSSSNPKDVCKHRFINICLLIMLTHVLSVGLDDIQEALFHNWCLPGNDWSTTVQGSITYYNVQIISLLRYHHYHSAITKNKIMLIFPIFPSERKKEKMGKTDTVHIISAWTKKSVPMMVLKLPIFAFSYHGFATAIPIRIPLLPLGIFSFIFIIGPRLHCC